MCRATERSALHAHMLPPGCALPLRLRYLQKIYQAAHSSLGSTSLK